MRGPTTASARAAVEAFADAPRGDRFHVRFRWWTCPFPALEREVPLSGSILEVGCGHGLLSLYLALASPARDVLGVDIDADKIALAARAAANPAAARAHVRFMTVGPGEFADGAFDAIVIADVLYLLPAAAREALLDACAAHLAPGGVLVLKETDRLPRWKGALTVAQELVSTRLLRITEGEQVEFASPGVFAARLASAGLDVRARRIDAGYLHPHYLIVARRPVTGTLGGP